MRHRFIFNCLIPGFLFLSGYVSAQQDKGLKPIPQPTSTTGKTRALIVGVSDYQHIEGLQFAHRDAEFFAKWLQSANVDQSDIVLLTNKIATRGSILSELIRLARLSKEGDHLVFYFSGHGDVENYTMELDGYLLPNDSYSYNYMVGAVSVNDLHKIFIKLCTDKVKVTVIVDACRSGKLAGGRKGIENTATLLKPLWNNEIKILSSEPNQLSMEGKQWGDGRGVFSYYLINGLEGDADANKDSLITIAELDSFVGNAVASITKNEQQPIIQGPNRYSNVVASLKKSLGQYSRFRGGNVFNRKSIRLPADSCQIYYERMETALLAGQYTGLQKETAEYWYSRLRSCSPESEITYKANAKFISKLMNEAQVIVNNTFIGEKLVRTDEYAFAIGLFQAVLRNNDLNIPLEESLVNLQRYLKALQNSYNAFEYSLNEKILDSALAVEPNAPHLLMAKGVVNLSDGNYTLAIAHLEKVISLSPGWLMPKYYLGLCYGYKRDYRKALAFYEEVLRRDTLARTYECAECFKKKIDEYRKRVSRMDENAGKTKKKYNLEELNVRRNDLSDDIDLADFYHDMALLASRKNHPLADSAFFYFTKSIELDPWEREYMYDFLTFLRKELYGEQEFQYWIRMYMAWRNMGETIEDRDEYWLYEELLYSCLYAKQYEVAFSILIKLRASDYSGYNCKGLRKITKGFGNYPPFLELLKECN